MKILVVDDSKAMRMIVIRNLRQAGFDNHEIKEANNGVEGMTLTKSWTPDLILCDWNMPEMNGIDFLKQIKTENIAVKFGFVTSESTPEMRKIASDNGALFLIGKPFTADTFKETLTSVIH